jgi:PDZ domain
MNMQLQILNDPRSPKGQPGLFSSKFIVLTLGLLALLVAVQDFAIAGETTDITGTITARRESAVKVEFKAHPKAAPKVGDRVDFKTMMQGFEAKAGKGEVTEVEASHVWVKVLEKNPKLKMTGVIHATGIPEKKRGRASLGVGIRPVTEAMANELNVEPRGALIQDIIPDSPAKKYGLQPKDWIFKIDNIAVKDISHFVSVIKTKQPGDSVSLFVKRNGNPLIIDVVLGQATKTLLSKDQAEYKFDIYGWEEEGDKSYDATLKISFPRGLNFKDIKGVRYEMVKLGVFVTVESGFHPETNNREDNHKSLRKLWKDGYGTIKWGPVWEDRKINGPSDCVASHVLALSEEGVDYRILWATCGKPGASYVPQQNYFLSFTISKRGIYWDEPWEDLFLKAVKSLSIETK